MIEKIQKEKELEYKVPDKLNTEEAYLSTPYTKSEADEKFKQAENELNKAKNILRDAIKKIDKIDYILFGVVIILLVMVATLVIDAFHINSAIYKEYSQKTQSVETTQKINQELLEQNIKNQEIITELHKEILKNKK